MLEKQLLKNWSTAEGTGEFTGNKITNKFVKPKPVPKANSRNVEEIVIPPEKKRNIE